MNNLWTRSVVAWGIALSTTILLTGGASAATPGELDQTFGGDGLAFVDLGQRDGASEAFRDDSGRIVLAGQSQETGSTGFRLAVTRLLPDGRLDTSYGDGGSTSVDPTPGNDLFMGAARGPGGGVVVLGGRGRRCFDCAGYTLVRFRADGRLDRSFGTDGLVKGTWGADPGSSRGDAIVVRPDWRILVVGRDGGDAIVRRHLADGRVDVSFADRGRLRVPDFDGTSLVRLDDGRIIVAGHVGQETIGARRFSADGVPDPTYGDDGLATIAGLGGYVIIEAAVVGPNGRLYVAGWTSASPRTFVQGIVAALTPEGRPARAFSDDGWRRVELANVTMFFGLTVAPDGRVVAVGGWTTTVFDPVPGQAAVVVFRPDGRLDRDFGDGGTRTLFIDHTDDEWGHDTSRASGVVVHGSRITVGGGAGGDVLAVRLHR